MNTFDIIKLIFGIAVPIMVFLFGFFFLKKIEGIKNQVNKKFQWDFMWKEKFFKEYLHFVEMCSEFISVSEQLRIKMCNGTQNSEDGVELHNKIDRLTLEIFNKKVQLDVLTTNIFDSKHTIHNMLDKTYLSVADLVNNQQVDPLKIQNKLKELHGTIALHFEREL